MQEKEQAETAQQQLLSDWDAWRTELGIPEPLKPDVAIELVPAIATAKDLLKQAADAQTDIAALRERIEGFEESATQALKAVGLDYTLRDAGLMAAIEGSLHGKVLADEKQRDAIEGLTTGVGGARKYFEAAKADLAAAEEARDQLLTDAGVEDAAALEQAIIRLKRRAQLETEIAGLDERDRRSHRRF